MSLITADKLNKFYKSMRCNSVFYIDFVGASAGDTYQIVSTEEMIAGVVPESLEIVETVKKLNTQYTVSITHNNETYYTTVDVGNYYGNYEVTINVSLLTEIAVRTPMTRTTYEAGDFIDTSGLGITATYENQIQLDVTEDCTFSIPKDRKLTTSDTVLTVYYTESGVTKGVNINLTITDRINQLTSRVQELEEALANLSETVLEVTVPDEE